MSLGRVVEARMNRACKISQMKIGTMNDDADFEEDIYLPIFHPSEIDIAIYI
jgi:hypothetical protein